MVVAVAGGGGGGGGGIGRDGRGRGEGIEVGSVGGSGEFSDEYDGEVVVAQEQQNSLSFSNAFGSANEDDEVDSTATTTKVTEQSDKKDD